MVWKRTASSQTWRQRVWNMCARDVLFFCNTFCVIFEPRARIELPFLTYPIQNRTLLLMNDALGRRDIAGEKSRDMGFSWVMLVLFLWQWLFYRLCSFMLVSRTGDLVDKTGDSDTLFWKIDRMLHYLPNWMKPTFGSSDRSNLHLRNSRNDSLIDGARTTGDAGRGGRRLAIGADEYAAFTSNDGYEFLGSSQANTNTRIFGSTPKGAMGAFHDIMHDPAMDMLRLKLHWSDHPRKQPGLYRSQRGQLEILDSTFRFPADYPFVLDGKLRSPWYDYECRRCPIPMKIAQELDIDYCASTFQAFDQEVIFTAIRRDAQPVLLRGELDYDAERALPSNCGFEQKAPQRIKLWHHVDANGRLPADSYVIGCDIAWGTRDNRGRGATISAANIYKRNGVKVAALECAGLNPKEFAKYVFALGRWLVDQDDHEAYLIWEANGPGQHFGDEVIRLGYSNFYRKTNEDTLSKRPTDIPGWWATKKSKISLFTEYQRALESGECCNRDKQALEECKHFVVLPDGSWAHMGSVGVLDPTGARENHGDRATADAVAWLGIRGVKRPESEEIEVPVGCFQDRRNQRSAKGKATEHWLNA